MTAKECPESGTRRSLKSTLALWAGRIALMFFRRPLNIRLTPEGLNPSMRKRTTHWRAAKVQRAIVLYSPNG